MIRTICTLSIGALVFFALPNFAQEKIGNSESSEPAAADETEYGPADEEAETQAAINSRYEPVTPEQLTALEGAPVWKPFITAFNKCAPGCKPLGVLAFRKISHPKSCLRTGHSMNIRGVGCGEGKDYKITKASQGGEFEKMIKCVSRSKEMKTFYKTGNHPIRGYREFALVSIGCQHVKGKPTWW